MKEFYFSVEESIGKPKKVRVGSRAILFRDGKVLLGHELETGYYTFPGGGMEGDETPQETCRREVAEEMGMKVHVNEEIAFTKSLWKDWVFENHFFLCEYEGETETNQTNYEANVDLRPEWVGLAEARTIFSDEEIVKRGTAWLSCYNRDLAVVELLMEMDKR